MSFAVIVVALLLMLMAVLWLVPAAAAPAVAEAVPFELLDTPVPDVVCEPYNMMHIGRYRLYTWVLGYLRKHLEFNYFTAQQVVTLRNAIIECGVCGIRREK